MFDKYGKRWYNAALYGGRLNFFQELIAQLWAKRNGRPW